MIKKIIHIAPYEKFIKTAYQIFELAFPHINLFYIVKQHEVYPYSLGFSGYKILESETYGELIKELNDTDLLIIHYLDAIKAKVIAQLPNNHCKIVWIPWGGDWYENSLFYQAPLFGQKTKQIMLFEFLALRIVFCFKNFFPTKINLLKQAIKQIDILACTIPQEFDFLKHTGLFKLDFARIDFSYYPLELIISQDLTINDSVNLISDTILVGNSANPTNNHAEVFDILTKLNIKTKKIVTPLNYGNMRYRTKIMSLGRKTFGKLYIPIVDFVPLTEYNKLISIAGFAIMNHYRQQALGNITTLLWGGTKIFLDERNLVYHFFKKIGCHIFSINQDFSIENLILLSNEEIQHNRSVLIKHFSTQFLITKLQKDLRLVYDSHILPQNTKC